MSKLNFDSSKLDVAHIFMCYMAVVGDVERTAAALNMDPAVIEALAEKFGWLEKIRRVSLLSKGKKPGEVDRAQNRALAFVQATRFRTMLDNLLRAVEEKHGDELLDAFTHRSDRGGAHLSARFLADLAAAMEKVHLMTYAALGDSAGERKDRTDDHGESLSPNAMHAAVIAALNNPEARALPPAELLKEEDVKEIAEAGALPPPPAIDV